MVRHADYSQELRVSQLQTGDVVLIREPHCAHPPACLAQWLACMTVNHAGVAINPADFPEASKMRDRVTLNSERRYLFHTQFQGIKVWELSRYLKRCRHGRCHGRGTFWVRQWLTKEDGNPAPRKLVAAAIDELVRLDWESGGIPYEDRYMDMCAAYWDCCEGCCKFCQNDGDDSSLFCSELVALLAQQGGFLTTQRPADEFVPMDFLKSDGQQIEFAQVCEGICLGPPRVVVCDGENDNSSDTDSESDTDASTGSSSSAL